MHRDTVTYAPPRRRTRALVTRPSRGPDASAKQARAARTAQLALEMELRAANAIAAAALAGGGASLRSPCPAEPAAVEDQSSSGPDIGTTSSVASSVGHGVRSSLAALVANLTILAERDTDQDPTSVAVLADSRLACRMIEDALNDLQTFTSAVEPPRRVLLSAIVDSTLRLLRWHLHQRGVSVTTRMVGEPAAWARAGEVSRLLYDVLVSATEATPRGGRIVLDGHAEGASCILRVGGEDPRPGQAPVLTRSLPADDARDRLVRAPSVRALPRPRDRDLIAVSPVGGRTAMELRLRLAPDR